MAQKIGVTMPGLGTSLDKFVEFAVLAEDAGFDSVWDYEWWRNPFTIHMLTASSTSRIQLGTGIAAALTRSPYEMANAAADVDERSDGRLILGMAPGASMLLEWFHSTDAQHSATRMKEYIDVVRMSWDQLETQDPGLTYAGKYYRFISPGPVLNPWGGRELARRRIPIYLGAMSPKMLELAGATAEGWIGFLCPPDHLETTIKPGLARGAEKVGRDPSEIKLASETICSIHEDREVAMHRARIHVGIYSSYPQVNDIIEGVGLVEDRNKCLEALLTHGVAALADTTSDALVEALSITGTPDEAREKLKMFGALDHILLHPPYMPPLSVDETEDAYRQIVSAFRR